MNDTPKRDRSKAGLATREVLEALPDAPIELRYRFVQKEHKRIYSLFREVCDVTSRRPRDVLLRLMESWALEEAERVGYEPANLSTGHDLMEG